jgi:hypothetical protein
MTIGLCLLAASALAQREAPADRFQRMSLAITVELSLGPKTGGYQKLVNSELSEDDDSQLATAGFRSVRFQIDARELSQEPAGPLNPTALKKLMSAIADADKAGLAVTLAPTQMGSTEDMICDFLTRFSASVSKTDPDKVFLETDADGLVGSASDWAARESRRIAAIRAALPRHTLLVAYAGPTAVDDIVKSKPLPEKNLVYGFRFFEPEIFTSQCLEGALIQQRDRLALPYGLTTSDAIGLLSGAEDRLKDPVMEYARGRWNYDAIEKRLRPVGEWARSNRVWIMAESFGVSQKVSTNDRGSYLKDVRTALSADGIGWCLDEYVGPYGIYAGASGNRQADSGVLSALGLSG